MVKFKTKDSLRTDVFLCHFLSKEIDETQTKTRQKYLSGNS